MIVKTKTLKTIPHEKRLTRLRLNSPQIYIKEQIDLKRKIAWLVKSLLVFLLEIQGGKYYALDFK